MLDRYKIALRTFEQGGGTLHTRLERSKSRGAPPRRRRASSITECFYNGDTPGAMNCLLQNPEISSQSKEFLRRLLETKQETRAFEALMIVLESQGTQLFKTLPKSSKVRHLLRMFASKVKQPSVALELLFLSGFWRDALKLSENLSLPLLEALFAVSLNETRRAAGGLRDLILLRLHETDGEICDAVAVPVSNLLRLHPTAADELFIDGLDLLLNEFLQESSRSSFDAPHTTLLMVEVFAEIPGQPSRLQLICRSIQLLLLCSEASGHLLDQLALSLHHADDSGGPREVALLRCFVNMLFCYQLRSRLFQATDDSESVRLAQQLYLNRFVPPHWLPYVAQIVYIPSLSEEEVHREALSDFYNSFCQDVCSTRTKLRQPTAEKSNVRISPMSYFERMFAAVRKASKTYAVRMSRLMLVDEKELDATLDTLNLQQARLKSGAKLNLCVLSDLLGDLHMMSSRAFLCGVLLYLDKSQAKQVRFNPIVDVAVDDSDEYDSSDADEKLQPAPESKLLKSFSTTDASVQADEDAPAKKLTSKLDSALKSLERISKLQKQMTGDRRSNFNEELDDRCVNDDLFHLREHIENIELKDMPVTSRHCRFSWNQVPGEGKFEESMRRIRELTSRSIQRYQVSTRNLRSSLRGRRILRQASTLSNLRVKVRPTNNGVHTTMVIDRRNKQQQQAQQQRTIQ
ncbi:uncharacterized protein LOC111270386 [Varroa jacobsoni]|uniref:uncharacterized protein LOC111270386 n=1 Tax=Varroa jacobsoni TaxID=62625 RepID=UPI000BFA6B29|nr:uncharacterized protein LOC111270386 [Varroa jacobsoni]